MTPTPTLTDGQKLETPSSGHASPRRFVPYYPPPWVDDAQADWTDEQWRADEADRLNQIAAEDNIGR